MMEINRRRFLGQALGCAGALMLPLRSFSLQSRIADDLLLSAFDDQAGQHWISGWHFNGRQQFRLPISNRAHAVSVSPDKMRAAFFSRRPGTEMYLVDLASGTLSGTISSPEGYHYYGHGVFSRDGRKLFTTENAYERQHGVVAVYDTDSLQRIGEYHSGNIGPHQLELLGDDRTLVIANGGILTHPSSARESLNLDSMQSTLTYMDSRDGKILGDYRPQHPQMSIRHLAVSATDQVVMGVQFQGDSSELLPLVLSHRGEEKLQPMLADELHWLGMNQYIASIAIDNNRGLALSTTPRGNNASLWHLESRELLRSYTVRDVAGAAYCAIRGGFLLSNGLGQILSLASPEDDLQPLFGNRDVRWDNHLALVS